MIHRFGRWLLELLWKVIVMTHTMRNRSRRVEIFASQFPASKNNASTTHDIYRSMLRRFSWKINCKLIAAAPSNPLIICSSSTVMIGSFFLCLDFHILFLHRSLSSRNLLNASMMMMMIYYKQRKAWIVGREAFASQRMSESRLTTKNSLAFLCSQNNSKWK